MKKALIVLVLAAMAAAGAWYYYAHRAPSAPAPTAMKTATLHIGAITIHADVADTPALREKGLAGRAALEDGQGMWFVFGSDGLWPFWMKDTPIPLDIIWADASSTIVHIERNVLPDSYPQAFAPETPARYVLEVPGGYADREGITEGRRIIQDQE